jgi:hypothetical protein
MDRVRSVDLAALWIAFVSAAAAIATAVIAWTARADALRAEKKADDASTEAQKSAERATVATEKMAAIQTRIFDGPPWTVEWLNGDSYLVTNNSPADALDVRIDGDPVDEIQIQVGTPEPRVIGAKSAFKFGFSTSMATPWERNIIVRWRREPNGEEMTWKHPIPPNLAR